MFYKLLLHLPPELSDSNHQADYVIFFWLLVAYGKFENEILIHPQTSNYLEVSTLSSRP